MSSSEYVSTYAKTQNIFNTLDSSGIVLKADSSIYKVRPVRAFGAISVPAAAIAGVTAPVTGETPVSATTAGTGYTGAVTWASSGAALSGTFAAATAYTATITLTPTSGYTLTGVAANSFSVTGATSVTNSANSGVITAVFAATGAGAASKVAITRASVGTARRSAFTTQPQITIQDSSGNTVTSSTALVTATVSSGGTLVGTVTATASSGVATFTGLGVDGTIGTTYTITYTASGLTPATATVTLTGTTCDGNSFTCQVGDTGPGGGIIFYVASGTFTQSGATGSMCSTNCKYLEAAPTTGTNKWTDAAYAWSGNTTVEIGTTARGTAIGSGYANTQAMLVQSATADKAGTIARAYGGPNSLTDWFLPSKDELNQMCKWARGITGVDLTTVTTPCSGGAINTGSGAAGFVADYYWSSSEGSASHAWLQDFYDGFQDGDGKNYTFYVRPVRAF